MEKNTQVLTLLDSLEETIENASNTIFSANKIILDRDQILDIVKEIRLSLPNDVRQATWVQKEKEKIIQKANEEAKQIVEKTEEFCKNKASDHEITLLAEKNAEEILKNAKLTSQTMKETSRDYSLDMLEKLLDNMEKIQKRIEANKQELENFDL